MRRITLNEIMHEIDQIHDVITLDCNIRPRTQIKAHLDRIAELCNAEHKTNNGKTMRVYHMKCKVSPEEMMASSEFIQLLNMAKGDVIDIECDKHHFQYLRALLKKNNPAFRLRTLNLCGIRRKVMRVDNG